MRENPWRINIYSGYAHYGKLCVERRKRVDGMKLDWLDAEKPLREREKNVAMDAFDLKWFDEIETKPEDGFFAISGGVIMYFTAEQIKPLFTALAEKFPGGGIIFDAENQKGVDKSNKVVRKSGNSESLVVLAVDDAEEMFMPWSDRFKRITTYATLPEKINKERKISFITKFMLKMAFRMGFMKFVEIEFK